MSAQSPDDRKRRVLGRVDRNDFIGRAAELQQILEHARRENAGGLLLLLAPTAAGGIWISSRLSSVVTRS